MLSFRYIAAAVEDERYTYLVVVFHSHVFHTIRQARCCTIFDSHIGVSAKRFQSIFVP